MATETYLQEVISIKFTEEVLLGILKEQSGLDGVKVDQIKLGAEFKKGDSYMSTVTRFSVDYIGKNEFGADVRGTIHMIAKGLPKNIGRRKTFRSTDFFKNEVSFYNDVWPKLDAFQKSKNPKTLFTGIPNCLFAFSDGLNDFLVLEDLSHDGFGNGPRASGLDIEHTKLILKVFAQFHALPYAFKKENPEEFIKIANSLQETYFHEKHRKWYENFSRILLDITKDAVANELPKQYSQKLNEVLSGDIYGANIELCAARGPLATITHGDAWIPNFLLKYDESKAHPLEAIMIDFQLARCSTFTLDLLLFLYACTDYELLKESFDDLVEYYYQEFKKFFTNLSSYEMFTLQDLKDDMKASGMYGLNIPVEGIVMSSLDDEEVSDLDLIQGEDAIAIETMWIVKPLKNEKRKRLAYFVKHLVDYGFI